MAKKSTKRQQPSKPGPVQAVAEENKTMTAAEDNAKARDLAPTHDPQGEHVRQLQQDGDRPRTKEEIEAGKKKGKYEVLTENAIFDGKTKSKVGDMVTLTADEAEQHRRHGVALGPVEK